jgi:uncharacterized membrane protein
MGPAANEILMFCIHMLEWMGISVIVFTGVRAFVLYIIGRFNFSDESIKVMLAKGLAVGLEFKLGAEILKTVMLQTLDEVFILAAVVVLRVILTFVIHWEIKLHEDSERAKASSSQTST